jgi:hypothetical protein
VTCVPFEIDPACCTGWDELDPELQARATELAWSTLRVLTAGRVGNCPVTVRPCLSPPCDVCRDIWMMPLNRNGHWMNFACPVNKCSCARLCEIVLPGPVVEVTAVEWGGEALPLSAFRIDNGNRLIRQDGECFPSCQRMDQPLGAPCTLGITYVPGVAPGPSGAWAAGVLACEFTKACTGAKCRLPSSVTSISRQGVSMEIDTGMFGNGLTGIREVDAYILSVNPHALRTPSMVWSPDLEPAEHRYTTWQGT